MTEHPVQEQVSKKGFHDRHEALNESRKLLRDALSKSDPVIADIMDHLSQSSGKNIRAALLLAAATNEEGFIRYDAARAAAALEILHLATLVHDDIIDDAPTRRGQPSAQMKFGKKAAVISGDYLLCLCFSMITGLSQQYPERLSIFSQAVSSLCLGELRQHKHLRDTHLSVLGYLRIIAGKTASLFSLALYTGGVLSGSDEKTCRLLGRVGYYMGILFQLVDDCLDYEADPSHVKKTVKRDLTEGVVTLPLIYAIQKKPELKAIAARENLTTSEARGIISDVMNLGGLLHAREVAEKYYKKAGLLLDQLETGERQRAIRSILDRLPGRKD